MAGVMPVPVRLVDRVKPLLPGFQRGDVECLFELVVFIATADGVVDSMELEALGTAFETMMGVELSPIVVNTLVGSACDAIEAMGEDAFAKRIGETLRARDKGLEGLRLGYAIAASNKEIAGRERERLEKIADAAGVTGAQLRRIDLESRP